MLFFRYTNSLPPVTTFCCPVSLRKPAEHVLHSDELSSSRKIGGRERKKTINVLTRL